ncbi:hypothetical protein FGB62_31g110 [Gracilaria domingensis]|nr:hypothetical protein FGB62_31g110 [Gracilaria domingensis]
MSSVLSAASLSAEDLTEFLEEGYELESTPQEELFPTITEEPATTPTAIPPTDVPNPTIASSSSQAANISRSRLAFSQVSEVSTSVRLPRSRSLNITVTLSGSINFEGMFAEDIETVIEEIVANSSSRLRDFFRYEKKSLQERAGDRYFFFFQAAANFGYANSPNTRRLLHSREFEHFTNQSALTLSSFREHVLKGNYMVPLELASTGQARLVSLNSYLYLSKVTLTSGKELTVITNSSQLVIADQHGNIYDDTHGVELRYATDLVSSGAYENEVDTL